MSDPRETFARIASLAATRRIINEAYDRAHDDADELGLKEHQRTGAQQWSVDDATISIRRTNPKPEVYDLAALIRWLVENGHRELTYVEVVADPSSVGDLAEVIASREWAGGASDLLDLLTRALNVIRRPVDDVWEQLVRREGLTVTDGTVALVSRDGEAIPGLRRGVRSPVGVTVKPNEAAIELAARSLGFGEVSDD